MWTAEPEFRLEPRCRCLSCWETTGLWTVGDYRDGGPICRSGPFVIGLESEAVALADYLNALEKNELDRSHP